jgi:hypothetical protein
MARLRTRIWASLLALAGSARADEPAPGGFEAALAQADQRFVAGDLTGALQLLGPVCTGSDRPECAFALGAIQHGLGHCLEALFQYRRYRRLAPAGEHRAEVDAALEDVESHCGAAPNPATAIPATTSTPAATTARPAAQPGVSASFLIPGLSLAATPWQAPLPSAVPSPDPAAGSLNRALVFSSFALSGAAAASSLIFGILATQSANQCEHSDTYDQQFIDECEHAGPRYQGLWQGFAVASGAFLGVGLSLWWFEPDTSASVGIAAGGLPALQLQHRF